MIKNEALVNEELDPKLVINRLRREVEELKNQLAISNNGDASNTAELTQSEIEKLVTLSLVFVHFSVILIFHFRSIKNQG